jgi:uncharacterized protein (TIGR02594 family)
MNLPEQYQWLRTAGLLPRTISIGLAYFGTQEVIGRGSNRTILHWSEQLNRVGVTISDYSDDSIPWCGLFAAWVIYQRASNPAEVVASPLWARNWAKYGKSTKVAGLGDVLVFVRKGGGHVGFYVGEDSRCYHVLGGNQSNAVTITRIQKDRCIAVRRPPYRTAPPTVRPFFLSASGTISTNEA